GCTDPKSITRFLDAIGTIDATKVNELVWSNESFMDQRQKVSPTAQRDRVLVSQRTVRFVLAADCSVAEWMGVHGLILMGNREWGTRGARITRSAAESSCHRC